MDTIDLARDGVLQLFDCLQIVGIDVFTEEVPKEAVQAADAECERNTLSSALPTD